MSIESRKQELLRRAWETAESDEEYEQMVDEIEGQAEDAAEQEYWGRKYENQTRVD